MINVVDDKELFRFSDLSNLLSERYRALRLLNEDYGYDPPGELKDLVVKYYDGKVIEAAVNLVNYYEQHDGDA